MGESAVVADTGPLIGLARIGLLPLLSQLFAIVYVPTEVVAEARSEAERSGAAAIHKSLRDGLLMARDVEARSDLKLLTAVLDQGEAEALLLAQYLGIPVLIDERNGRGVARAMGLTVIGTGAVLVAAKNAGLRDRGGVVTLPAERHWLCQVQRTWRMGRPDPVAESRRG